MGWGGVEWDGLGWDRMGSSWTEGLVIPHFLGQESLLNSPGYFLLSS